jgi:hypothetical protein
MARLTAEFWVQAYLARLRLADIPPSWWRAAMRRRVRCW